MFEVPCLIFPLVQYPPRVFQKGSDGQQSTNSGQVWSERLRNDFYPFLDFLRIGSQFGNGIIGRVLSATVALSSIGRGVLELGHDDVVKLEAQI